MHGQVRQSDEKEVNELPVSKVLQVTASSKDSLMKLLIVHLRRERYSMARHFTESWGGRTRSHEWQQRRDMEYFQ